MKRYLILILVLCLLAVCHSTAQVNQINVGLVLQRSLNAGPPAQRTQSLGVLAMPGFFPARLPIVR